MKQPEVRAKSNEKNKLLEHRLTLLEANDKRIEGIINEVREDVRDIRDNHIAKIHTRLDAIEDKLLNRLPGWSVIIITFLSSLSVALIIFAITK